MITAGEVRALMPETVETKLECLLETIKELASQGKRQCKTGWMHKEHSELWQHGGYAKTGEWMQAANTLVSLGFKVQFVYNEGQFVDMHTLIEW